MINDYKYYNGNLIIAGSFNLDSIWIFDTLIVNSGMLNNEHAFFDCFLASYNIENNSLNWLWSTYNSPADYQGLGTGNTLERIALDHLGNIYTTGHIIGVAEINDTISLCSDYGGQEQGFITKFKQNGDIAWARNYKGWGMGSTMSNIAINNDIVFIKGNSYGGALYWEDSLICESKPANQMFFYTIDTAGNFKWSRSIFNDAESNDSNNSGVLTQTGSSCANETSVYVTGMWYTPYSLYLNPDSLLIDASASINPTTNKYHYPVNHFIAKFDINGNFKKVITVRYKPKYSSTDMGSANYYFRHLTTDAEKNLYAVTYFSNDTMFLPQNDTFLLHSEHNKYSRYTDYAILKFDSMLNFQHAWIGGGSGIDFVTDLKINDEGNFLIAGTTNGDSVTIGDTTLYRENFFGAKKPIWGWHVIARESATGLLEVIKQKPNFTLYPNPTSGMVTINGLNWNNNNKPDKAEIYNLQGHKVKEINLENNQATSHTLNLSPLPKGVYFVKIGEETKKIVLM